MVVLPAASRPTIRMRISYKRSGGVSRRACALVQVPCLPTPPPPAEKAKHSSCSFPQRALQQRALRPEIPRIGDGTCIGGSRSGPGLKRCAGGTSI